MDEKLKKKIIFVGSIFVALMFITSYFSSTAAYPSSGAKKPVTAAKNVTTYLASGNVIATVIGYGSSANITVANASGTTAVKALLNSIENSNFTYINTNNSFTLFMSNPNALSNITALLSNSVSYKLSYTEHLSFPSTVNLTIAQHSVPVYMPHNFTSMPSNSFNVIGSKKSIHVLAIVAYENNTFSVYNNSMKAS